MLRDQWTLTVLLRDLRKARFPEPECLAIAVVVAKDTRARVNLLGQLATPRTVQKVLERAGLFRALPERKNRCQKKTK